MIDETLEINLQEREATTTRDSIAKLVYKNLFTYIVEKVNASISLGKQ